MLFLLFIQHYVKSYTTLINFSIFVDYNNLMINIGIYIKLDERKK